MNSSVYSLVLMDDVIHRIDELAYAMHTSRSNLINQILAEKLQMVTPEMRYQDIFQYLEQSIQRHSGFQLQAQPSQTMISIKSPLQYKYRPVIRYCVELYREPQDAVGELRVMVRTQSQQLMDDLEEFARLWARLENEHAAAVQQKPIEYHMEPGKLSRKLSTPSTKEGKDHESIAHNIEAYLTMFDTILKRYFSNLEDPHTAAHEAQDLYEQYVKHGLPEI